LIVLAAEFEAHDDDPQATDAIASASAIVSARGRVDNFVPCADVYLKLL
jgi:hypothetical protein